MTLAIIFFTAGCTLMFEEAYRSAEFTNTYTVGGVLVLIGTLFL